MRVGGARLRAVVGCTVMALCAMVFAHPAAADDGPTATPSRAAPIPRSYPRKFTSYDELIGYANDVALTQSALDARLADLRARGDAAASALVAASDPRARGGLLRGRNDAIGDGPSVAAVSAQIAADAASTKQLVADGALAPAGGTWRVPLDGELTQPFGPTDVWVEPARVRGGVFYAHFHDGVDIAAPRGSPVVAAAAGRVVFVGMMSDGAEIVVIAHDGGLVSMYAHLAVGPLAPPVRAGDGVQAGDRIGSVGMTGMTTGPHVHWAVWRDGTLVDPLSITGG